MEMWATQTCAQKRLNATNFHSRLFNADRSLRRSRFAREPALSQHCAEYSAKFYCMHRDVRGHIGVNKFDIPVPDFLVGMRNNGTSSKASESNVEAQAYTEGTKPKVNGFHSLTEEEECLIDESESDEFEMRKKPLVLNQFAAGEEFDGKEHKMLAAVDMGTNSFHMVIVRADFQGRFEIEDVEKEDVRLGSGSAGFSVITPEAEERALSAIKRLKKIATTRKAAMRVVATSAVREAKNKRAFIRRIQETTGVEVEVLTGREEACLIYAGILQALPVFSRSVLTVDIGGGSTEFVLGKNGKPLYATSLKLGHIRLTERFVGNEPLSRAQIDEMRRYIRLALVDSGVIEEVRKTEYELAIGSSGTIETIECMIQQSGTSVTGGPGTVWRETFSHGSRKGEPTLQPKVIHLEELSAMVKKICKAKTPEARAKIPGLPDKRADVIVGGAILLEEIFLAMGIKSMQVSPYALREGVVVDTLARTFHSYCPTPNLRRASVLSLANKFNVDKRMESALHSASLALEILSGLETCRVGVKDCLSEAVLQLEEGDAELLEASTILHYVGMFISHKGYHKHSYYLIKNSEHLLGFTPIEIEMIALLVRYHRKKVPSAKDDDFTKLPDDSQRRLRVLCAILRVAVALDRCDSGAVASLRVLQDHSSVVLVVSPALDNETGKPRDVATEVWAAQNELEFFEKVFKRQVSIVVADQPDMENFDYDNVSSLST